LFNRIDYLTDELKRWFIFEKISTSTIKYNVKVKVHICSLNLKGHFGFKSKPSNVSAIMLMPQNWIVYKLSTFIQLENSERSSANISHVCNIFKQIYISNNKTDIQFSERKKELKILTEETFVEFLLVFIFIIKFLLWNKFGKKLLWT